MTGTDWILIDTETSGLTRPICCVELGAQRMRGVTPLGDSFRALLNHDVAIDPMAQSIHGYSREFLRRHGGNPEDVHANFIRYAGALPLVAFNLSFDWSRVLAPELERLGLAGDYHPGFCALTLARRCIHETAGHGLHRLRAHFFPYHRGTAHRALDDVALTVRLIAEVLWPRLERAGVRTFAEVATFSKATPLASCRRRLQEVLPRVAGLLAAGSSMTESAEQTTQLEAKVDELAGQSSLEMHDVAALREWLADRRGLQSALAMSCRGLVEISFSASSLPPIDLLRLKGHLTALDPHRFHRSRGIARG